MAWACAEAALDGRQSPAREGLAPPRDHPSHDPDGQWMGQRDIRTLLVSGAMAFLRAVERFGTPNNGWLRRLQTHKPRMFAAIALANTPLTHAAYVLPGSGCRVASGPW